MSYAAVNEQQLRFFRKAAVAVFQMRKAAIDRLRHAGIVVAYIKIAYPKFAIVFLIWLALLMHGHRGHDARIAEV